MIYRIDQDEDSPYIDLDGDINFNIDLHKYSPELGNMPFFLVSEIHSYADVWNSPHIQFLVDEGIKTDSFPDLDIKGGKLFLSEKAYNTLKGILSGHGEFLPVTFNAGTGYIFNPLEDIAPIKESIEYDPTDSRLVLNFKFNESNLPPIFKSDIDTRYVFITTELYRTIRLNGLNGLWFFKDYGFTYADPEGGYKGSTSMHGYEDED